MRSLSDIVEENLIFHVSHNGNIDFAQIHWWWVIDKAFFFKLLPTQYKVLQPLMVEGHGMKLIYGFKNEDGKEETMRICKIDNPRIAEAKIVMTRGATFREYVPQNIGT